MTLLAEDLILLSLDYEKGKIDSAITAGYRYGLTGALLSELNLLMRLDLRNNKVVIINQIPTNNKILDEVMALIEKSAEEATVTQWVDILNVEFNNLEERILDNLVEKKILVKKENTFLWVIHQDKYIPKKPDIELDIRQQIREVLIHNKEPNNRMVHLISLINACRMIPYLFTEAEQKIAEERSNEITKNEIFGQAVSVAINQMYERLIYANLGRSMIFPGWI